MPIQQTEKEVVYKKIHDEIPMNATYKTRVIFTGNSPVLVLICTIDMTFIVCMADHLIQVLIFMTVKSFLIFTTCLKKCLDTTYIYLLITITHGRHIFLIHITHMQLLHIHPLVWKLVISQCCGKTYIRPRKRWGNGESFDWFACD